MKKNRIELEHYLLKQCERLAVYTEKLSAISGNLSEKYEIPTGITMDMLARGKFAEQTEFVLFCCLDGIKEFTSDKNIVEEFFVPIEIEKYSVTKFPKKRMKFPIVIKCNQVADDQWIGAADTNFFMLLREMQLINYNENAQRTLTKKITSSGEYYSITVNEKTVKGIMTRLQNNEYIPTPITLNIPLEVNSDFYYDEEQGALIINSLPAFDISDGYHRYVAMYRLKDSNPEFNYKWELRIVNFTEDRAQYFVYQESLKTPMRSVDKQAMNSYSAANRVTAMLNQDTTFGLFGQINNAGGKISASLFAKLVDAFYFKYKNHEDENSAVRNVKNILKNKINHLLDVSEKYNEKYTYIDLMAVLYVISQIDDNDDLDSYITIMKQKIQTLNPTKLQESRPIAKVLLNDLNRMLAEVK